MFIIILLKRHSDLISDHVEVKHPQRVNVFKLDGVVVFDSKLNRIPSLLEIVFRKIIDCLLGLIDDREIADPSLLV